MTISFPAASFTECHTLQFTPCLYIEALKMNCPYSPMFLQTVLLRNHWGFQSTLTGSNRHLTRLSDVASGLGQKSKESEAMNERRVMTARNALTPNVHTKTHFVHTKTHFQLPLTRHKLKC